MINAKGEIFDVKWCIHHQPVNYGREFAWEVYSDIRGKESGNSHSYDLAVGEITKRVTAASLGIPKAMDSSRYFSNEA